MNNSNNSETDRDNQDKSILRVPTNQIYPESKEPNNFDGNMAEGGDEKAKEILVSPQPN